MKRKFTKKELMLVVANTTWNNDRIAQLKCIANGERQVDIAAKFNVEQGTVASVLTAAHRVLDKIKAKEEAQRNAPLSKLVRVSIIIPLKMRDDISEIARSMGGQVSRITRVKS